MKITLAFVLICSGIALIYCLYERLSTTRWKEPLKEQTVVMPDVSEELYYPKRYYEVWSNLEAAAVVCEEYLKINMRNIDDYERCIIRVNPFFNESNGGLGYEIRVLIPSFEYFGPSFHTHLDIDMYSDVNPYADQFWREFIRKESNLFVYYSDPVETCAFKTLESAFLKELSDQFINDLRSSNSILQVYVGMTRIK